VLVLGEWLTPARHAFTLVDEWLEGSFGEGNTEEWKRSLAGFIEEIKQYEESAFK
jgi:ribose 5-phosphate isomerase RpiB